MGIYLSALKTEKASEDGENGMLRFGLSSMQGWRASMEDAENGYNIFRFGLCTLAVFCICTMALSRLGKAVSKFCAKFLHQQVLRHEAYLAGEN
ncbi:hypothetical protein KIW84_075597 [Lathyrus oleraceus]|uniref:Uncharacterized protein n=1 Tax=Pisum sativum TaxID=3888 RepID=A0A9D4VVL4_PEA|nr:hypothetical protein KIW84_075597 [Pisum sativum]